MSIPIISIKGLRKDFLSAAGSLPVLKDVNLEVAPGEFVAIMGASGSGKSTLLNILGGLLPISSGEVRVDGVDLSQLSDDKLTAFRRDKLGFIFQMFNLVSTLNVEENILLPSLAGGKKVTDSQLTAMIEKVGMIHRRTAMPNHLSGGEQQRVAIARALISEPVLVLADEPTGNLDSENTRLIGKLFHELHHEKKSVFLLVTHAPDVAMWAERVVILKDGQIVDDVPTSRFACPADLSAHYERVIATTV